MPSDPTASAVDVIARALFGSTQDGDHSAWLHDAEKVLTALHAAGLAVVPREQVEWQDISTAPRDAVIIICAVGSPSNLAFAGRQIVHPAYIDEDDRICEVGTCKPEIGIVAGAWIATHWRPLPAAPSAPPSERAGGDS